MSSGLVLAAGKGFVAPSPSDFVFSPLFGKGTVITKPMAIVIVGSILVAAFFYLAARRARVVPGKMQFAGEAVYGFVRNSIAAEAIGHGYRKFVPYLVTLFSFVFVMNIAGIVPLVNFPATLEVRLPVVPRDHLLRHLQRGRHPAGRLRHVLQGHHVPARRAVAGLHPAGPDRVPLDRRHPAGDAHPASPAQHVRRPPGARAVHPRWRLHVRTPAVHCPTCPGWASSPASS